jgi:hypothetical protein
MIHVFSLEERKSNLVCCSTQRKIDCVPTNDFLNSNLVYTFFVLAYYLLQPTPVPISEIHSH